MSTNENLKKWINKVINSKNPKYIYDFALSMNEDLSEKDIQKLTDTILYVYKENDPNIFDFIKNVKGVNVDYILNKWSEKLPFSFTKKLYEIYPNIPYDKIVNAAIHKGSIDDIYELIINGKNSHMDELLNAFCRRYKNTWLKLSFKENKYIINLASQNIGDVNVWANLISEYASDNSTICDFLKNCKILPDKNLLNKLLEHFVDNDKIDKYSNSIDEVISLTTVKSNILDLNYLTEFVIKNYKENDIVKFAIKCQDALTDDLKDKIAKHFTNLLKNDNESERYINNVIKLAINGIGDTIYLLDEIIATNNVSYITRFAENSKYMKFGKANFSLAAKAIAKIGSASEIVDFSRLVNNKNFYLLNILASGLANAPKDDNYAKLINDFFQEKCFFTNELIEELIKTKDAFYITNAGIKICNANNSASCIETIEKLATATVNTGNVNIMYQFLINSNGYAINILMEGIINSKNYIYIQKAMDFLEENNLFEYALPENDIISNKEFKEFMVLEENEDKKVKDAIAEFNNTHTKTKVKKITKH